MSITVTSDAFELLVILLNQSGHHLDRLAKRMGIIEHKITRNPRPREALNKEDSQVRKKTAPPSILVVDDDKKLALSYKLILESEGYIVDTAYTGSSALFRMSKNTYDLVILDYYLPDIFGDKVVEQIEKKDSDTDILIITGYSSLSSEVEGERELLTKPINPESLLEATKNRLAMRARDKTR